MDVRYERVTTTEGLPFKLFIFEGREGNYKVVRHWHQSIEVFLVLEGAIDFYTDEDKHSLEAGQFVVVNSNEIHSIEAPEKNFTLVLQIPRQQFYPYIEEEALTFKRTSTGEDRFLIEAIKEMYRSFEAQDYGYTLLMKSQFYHILYHLLTKYKLEEIDEKRRRQNRQLEKLSQITHYIKEHYQEEITLESVAEQFGFNPTYLSKMFQKYARINYKTYVMDIRVEKAYRELIGTQKSLGQIAEDNGFSDSRSLAKAFEKRFGVVPSTYRKMLNDTKGEGNEHNAYLSS